MNGTVSHAELMQEVQALRQTVEALKLAIDTRHRVTLRPVKEQPLLGQSVTIVATVTGDYSGTPRIGVPVTFVSTWGKLRTADGYTIQQGETVTARTGVDGKVRVTLMPPTSEDLWDIQQDCLETMLLLLDADVSTPRETEEGLQRMVQQYRWDANLQFRHAVDIYFREFRHDLLDTVNNRDYMQAWSHFDSTVIAYAGSDGAEGTSTTSGQGTAALRVQFKDWLGPWLQTYLTQSKSENPLGEAFQDVKQRGGDADALIDGVFSHVDRFVADQRGWVAGYIGQKVAETTIRDFLDSGIDDLPLETRLALFPALKIASSAVAGRQVNRTTATIAQQRASLDKFRIDLTNEAGRVLESAQGALQVERTNAMDGVRNALQLESANAIDGAREALQLEQTHLIDEVRNTLQLESTNTVNEARAALQLERTNAINEVRTAVQREIDSTLPGRIDAALPGRIDTAIDRALPGKIDAALPGQIDATLPGRIDAVLPGKVDAAIDKALPSRIDVILPGKIDATLPSKVEAAIDRTLPRKIDETLPGRIDAVLPGKIDATLPGRIDATLPGRLDAALPRRLDTILPRHLEPAVASLRNEINTKLDKKVDTATFQTELGRKVDTTTLNTALARKVNATTFNQLSNRMNSELTTLQDTTASLTANVSTLENAVTRVGNNTLALRVDLDQARSGKPNRISSRR